MTPARMAALHALCFTHPRPWSEAEFCDLLGDPACFPISADHGFALGRQVLDEAELLTIAVDPAIRRAGHGAALLSRFEAEATRRGATTAFLEVASDNDAAQALYLNSGWGAAGRRPGYYGAGIDALILTKQLR